MFLLGGISLIFPVHSDNEVHYAGVWGGTKIPASASDTEDYINSIKHYIEECNKMNVDISVQAHPFVDYSLDKGIFNGKTIQRDINGKHPLILEEERFQLFYSVLRHMQLETLKKIKESL